MLGFFVLFYLGEAEWNVLPLGGANVVLRFGTFYGIPFVPHSTLLRYPGTDGMDESFVIDVPWRFSVGALLRVWSALGGLGVVGLCLLFGDGPERWISAGLSAAVAIALHALGLRAMREDPTSRLLRVVGLDVLGVPVDPRWLRSFARSEQGTRVQLYLETDPSDAAARVKAEVCAACFSGDAKALAASLVTARGLDPTLLDRAMEGGVGVIPRRVVPLPPPPEPPALSFAEGDQAAWDHPIVGWVPRGVTWPRVVGALLVPAGLALLVVSALHRFSTQELFAEPIKVTFEEALRAAAGGAATGGLFLALAPSPRARIARAPSWAVPGFLVASWIGAAATYFLVVLT